MNPLENNLREAIYNTALTSGGSAFVPIGADFTAIMDARHYRYLLFGFQSELAATVLLQGAIDYAFTAARTLFTIARGAATYTTVYDLPAPENATGVFVLSMPFIRLQLSDDAVSNHAYTEIYVKIW